MARKRAVIYCRVSGRKQEDNWSLPDQLERCVKWCERHGYEVVCVFKEVHTGAELDERPEMSKLREMMRRRDVDVLVAVVLDRLARNQNHLEVLLYDAGKYDVRIELTEEQYEDTPIGRHMRSVQSFVNELERDRIRTRTANGRNQRVSQGNMIPGKVPLYGYMWGDIKKTHYVLHPETVPIVQRIFMEAAMGKPIRGIAAGLTRDGIPNPTDQLRLDRKNPENPPRGDPWAKTTVWNILKHPAYHGQHSAFRWDISKRREVDPLSGDNISVITTQERTIGDKRVVLAHAAPPIITREIAEAVAKRMIANQEASARNNKHPELALLRGGFAKCGLCEGNLVVSWVGKTGQQTPIYRCGHARYNASGGHVCRGVTITVRKLDTAVWGKVLEKIQDPNTLEEEVRKRQASGGNRSAIIAIERRVKRLEQDQLNIRKAIIRMEGDGQDAETDDFLAGLIADGRKAAQDKAEALEEIVVLERQQHEWERVQERLQNARVWCEAVAEGHGTLSYEEKRTILFGLATIATVNAAGHKPRASLTVGPQTIELLGVGSSANGVEFSSSQNEIVSQSGCPRASRSS